MIKTIDKYIEELEDAVLAQKKAIDQLTKEKNQAYSERNKVVAALATILASAELNVYLAKHDEEDSLWDKEWRNILVIETFKGQITWHLHDSDLPLFKQFEFNPAYKYDGHTTEEKYKRLAEFTSHFEILQWE